MFPRLSATVTDKPNYKKDKRVVTRRSTRQSVIIVLFVFICFINNISLVSSIKCYKCSMTKPSPHINETVRLCAHFDKSSTYIVDCPYSTMCMKKDISVNLTTMINATERDCAQQRYNHQVLEANGWQEKISIEEPYAEGCSIVDDKGLRSSHTSFCYCRGDLCNDSRVLQPSQIFIFLSHCILFFIFK